MLVSTLLFCSLQSAEKKYGVSAWDILVELGRQGTDGGQEDMIEGLALTMTKKKGCNCSLRHNLMFMNFLIRLHSHEEIRSTRLPIQIYQHHYMYSHRY
ncbi:MAG: hypothetical protein ABW092_00870 [Candidatus Thiodiazotropha sp.]